MNNTFHLGSRQIEHRWNVIVPYEGRTGFSDCGDDAFGSCSGDGATQVIRRRVCAFGNVAVFFELELLDGWVRTAQSLVFIFPRGGLLTI